MKASDAPTVKAPSDGLCLTNSSADEPRHGGHLAGTEPRCRWDLPRSWGLPRLRGDRAQLIQVMDNLLSNAVRYGRRDGKALIELNVTSKERSITIAVTDHGPGIPREHLPRVTERFYRVDPARSRETGGTGLGLSIVKHIVERHRGSLEVGSTVGLGTTVSVQLPAHPE